MKYQEYVSTTSLVCALSMTTKCRKTRVFHTRESHKVPFEEDRGVKVHQRRKGVGEKLVLDCN